MNYSYIDVTETKDHVIAWCRDMEGSLIVKQYPISDYLYCFTPSNNDKDLSGYTDLYGSPLKKISFESKWDMREWTKDRTNLCESDVSASYKLLLDEFSEAPQEAPMNAWFYDIEADFDLSDGRGYPLPSNPFGEVNSFQFYDSGSDQYYLINFKKVKTPVDPDGKKVNQITVTNEKELLLKVSDLLDSLSCDVMLAWNGNGFDLPYLMARSILCFGETFAKKMFCRDGFNASSREFVDEYGNEATGWKLVGRQHVDMMEQYKKFIPGEKSSFSLSNVCLEDLGEDKTDYDGDLGQLYRDDPELFFEYAFQDVRLLKMLDDKHQILKLAISLSRMNCVKLVDVTGAVKPIEHGIMKFAHKDGIFLPDKVSNNKEKFEGAIVYDTIAGRHGWLCTIDLNQLYPATIMLMGMSPEVMIMQLDGEYDDYVKVMGREDVDVTVSLLHRGNIVEKVVAKASDVEAMIRENNYIISAVGIIFSGEFGLLSRYVKYVTDQRTMYKNLMKSAKTPEERERYNLFQKVVKINANSIYGCSGESSFRLYDLRLSRSITMTARVISKFQAWKSNDIINKIAEM
jgi:DNA polymerase elongation subunit (family B)